MVVRDELRLVEGSIVGVSDLGEALDGGIDRIWPETTQVHFRTSTHMALVGHVVARCRNICTHQSLPTEIQQPLSAGY
jgi:hypothetical protein